MKRKNINLSTRSFVRIISFAAAIVATLGIYASSYATRAQNAE